jgi:hypothetical protein
MAKVDTCVTQIMVFLGSPSDLIEEREQFSKILDEVNFWSVLQGIRFEPRTNADVSRDMGDPQDLINNKIFKDCKIFALLLWKRWGTPTTKYTSGFEEEYETAKALKEENSDVKICLYLRDIPIYMLDDPGPELIQVLAFRAKVEIERECLYGPYKDVDEWAKLLKQDLRDWLNQPRILKHTKRMKAENET